MSPALAVYRLITRLLEPLAPRLLDARAKQGKEDPVRVDERLGRASIARPDGDLVWLHGVSVGETLSLLPVVQRLRSGRPDLTVLVTSGTLTSAQLLASRLPPGVIHQFAPVDAPGAVAAIRHCHHAMKMTMLRDAGFVQPVARAYSDSSADLPLLQAATHPVVVNPKAGSVDMFRKVLPAGTPILNWGCPGRAGDPVAQAT